MRESLASIHALRLWWACGGVAAKMAAGRHVSAHLRGETSGRHERQEASMNSLKEKMARLFRREATAKDDQFEERLKRLTAAKPARPLSRYSRNPVLFRRDMASV
jgi:hypothetical protein